MPRPAFVGTAPVQFALLTLIACGAVYERTTLGPLQEAVKASLHLIDPQLATLQGPALAWPMVLVAGPLGYLCDRVRRTRLILGLVLAGLAASLASAWAPNFYALVAARCVAGVSAYGAAAVVLIITADLFRPELRGRATMAVTLGMIVGVGAAFAFGGLAMKAFAASAAPWRWALSALAAPLVLPALAAFALVEPPRREMGVARPTPRAILQEALRMRTLLFALMAGVILDQVVVGASLVWGPSVLARSYQAPPLQVGMIMSAVGLGSGLVGAVAGGVAADFAQARGGAGLSMAILGLLALLSAPASAFGLMPDIAAAGVVLTLLTTLGALIAVISTTVTLVLVPNELRGTINGVMQAGSLLVGGVAPFAVSLIAGAHGELGPALLWVGSASGVGGALLFLAGARKLYAQRTAAGASPATS